MELFFPEANNWLWNREGFINLGKFECQGKQYDLGMYIEPTHPNYVSHAIVYGNEPNQYLSGEINPTSTREVCVENLKRFKEYLKEREGNGD